MMTNISCLDHNKLITKLEMSLKAYSSAYNIQISKFKYSINNYTPYDFLFQQNI